MKIKLSKLVEQVANNIAITEIVNKEFDQGMFFSEYGKWNVFFGEYKKYVPAYENFIKERSIKIEE